MVSALDCGVVLWWDWVCGQDQGGGDKWVTLTALSAPSHSAISDYFQLASCSILAIQVIGCN